jgi:mannose-6-phosphate isomerase-like protein (cupin superfamily)
MLIRRMGAVPRNERGAGQVSHLLLGLPDDEYPMSVTMVEAAPGSQQPLHAHTASTQVYLVIEGSGRMIVDGEEADVTRGDMVCIPPRARHAIRNTGDRPLTYVSATAPPFPARVDGPTWQPAD